MTSFPRRTLDELTVRYELEPGLRDVYVEGHLDRNLLEWFLMKKNISSIKVYEIDTVDIPDELIGEMSSAKGNKGRLIALSRFLENELDHDLLVVCVIDRDFDYVFGRICESKYILYTDYACMEAYFYNLDVFQKFYLLYLRRNHDNANQFLRETEPILSNLFLVRIAKEVLAPGITWTNPRGCFHVTDGRLVFDCQEYVRRLLNSGGWPVDEENFFAKMEDFKKLLPVDARLRIHGHDLIQVTILWVKKVGRYSRRITESEVLGALASAIEMADIETEPMFQNVA